MPGLIRPVHAEIEAWKNGGAVLVDVKNEVGNDGGARKKVFGERRRKHEKH